MCGITGYWLNQPNWNQEKHQAALAPMVQALHSRGPDGEGTWSDSSAGIALGHRRLAIQDLSDAGRQPMVSANGQLVLSYNGELYQTDSLRNELASNGTVFKGHSDSEVLVEALAEWGLETTLSKLNGMFAFAVWDRQQQSLTLVRDRIGIKPLYYGWQNGNLIFGSELKAIRKFSGFTSNRNPQAVREFMQVGYIPAPLSIEKNIFKLLPGQRVTIHAPQDRPTPVSYWSLYENAVQDAQTSRLVTQEVEAVERLEQLLTESVSARMISDVPLGAFLSGGIDSSLVVALMQKLSSQRIKTFSIGFEVEQYNEAGFAKQIADHLQTDHHELIVTSKQAQQVIPQLASMYDEPFADSSQIPTHLVSRFAREQVTVALSGDGGDELFGGYRRYPYFVNLWQKINRIPKVLRPVAALALKTGSRLPVPERYRQATNWRAELMNLNSFTQCYEQFNRHWKYPEQILNPDFLQAIPEDVGTDSIAPYCLLPEQRPLQIDNKVHHQFEWMMLCDTLKYLPDDILTKVDRASMACGLEVRVPLLDSRVVQFSWQLASQWKQGDRFSTSEQTGKVLLRKLLGKCVPQELFERPKIGFGVPLDVWLRSTLREWAEELLDERHLQQQGIFQVKPLRQIWQEHLSGQADWQYLLWDVLMFQAFEGIEA